MRMKRILFLLGIVFLLPIFAACENQTQVSQAPTPNAEVDIAPPVDTIEEEPTPSIEQPTAAEQVAPEPEEEDNTCFLSVRCDSALGVLGEEHRKILPQDGAIFAKTEVVFYPGESVFQLLTREMKKNQIHLEFQSVPLYNSAYIEGIANLYEFDCGEHSGWMYRVNGTFPNYGCSNYQLQPGDNVEWVYTCDLGRDVGGEKSARNGREYE